MSTFNFDLQPIPGASDDLRALTIRAHQSVLTRVIRRDSNDEESAVHVPITALAFWLADHWWRLRWECRLPEGVSSNWRGAHELGAVGSGYSWPRVTIWGEGERVVLLSRADPVGVVGPTRFLQNAVSFVPAADFEGAVDQLLQVVTEIATPEDRLALLGLIEALEEERSNPDIATWRRLEAITGYNPDQAPEKFINLLLDLGKRYSLPDVEEAAAARPGETAATTLLTALGSQDEGTGISLSFKGAVAAGRAAFHFRQHAPWQLAEAAASAVRSTIDANKRPLRNKALGDLLGIDPRELQTSASGQRLPYGLRIKTELDNDLVFLQARWGHDRRFELMRSLGDGIWTNNSSFGPISRSLTARQKFQRAFAASILCPLEALRDYLQTDDPQDEDISEAARHFHVSEKVVRTILVNKRVTTRDVLAGPFDGLVQESLIQTLADAA